MKSGSYLLEYLAYLVLALVIIAGALTFVVRMIAVHRKFEHTVLASAAVHNVVSLLRQDAARMPCQRQAYGVLTEHDFLCTVTSTSEVIRWYIDDSRVMRASRVDGAWDYSVVLEPVQQCSFTYRFDNFFVTSITIDLVHNGILASHTLWLRRSNVHA